MCDEALPLPFGAVHAPEARPAARVSELVRRAQEGEEAAFETLYRQHVGRVYAVCLRLTADRATAEELTQEAFVRAWERLGSFRGKSAFGTWLHRLTINVVFMARRSARRREARVTTDAQAGIATSGRADDAGARLDLERAIASLPERAREVFVLHDIEGYQHREIARLTGIAAGTSKAQLFRARRLLRERLEP